MNRRKKLFVWGLALLFLAVSGCAAGNARFAAEPAGFWAGLWHGLICLVTFIIGLFTDKVQMYEANNVGGWYNFGFLIGVACFFGGSWGSHRKQKRRKNIREREWEEIGVKVEEKVRRGIRNWLKESGEEDKEWDEIAKKIEEKIKRELSDWADK
jgi:hypothetical protein